MIGLRMRLATFSVVRCCRRRWLARQISSDSATEPATTDTSGYETLLSFSTSWPPSVEPELRSSMLCDLRVLPSFITEQEEIQLMSELEPALRRMRYEYDHWDDAIHGYKETERGEWRPENEAALARVRAVAFGAAQPGEPQPRCHVLDLAPGGHIKPHIDAVRYCGAVIAGLCLLSDAVMRLQHSTRPELRVDALLPRRGLYIMTGSARYSFTHAVLSNEESQWNGRRVVKKRRVAVITRSVPEPQQDETGDPVLYTTITSRGSPTPSPRG